MERIKDLFVKLTAFVSSHKFLLGFVLGVVCLLFLVLVVLLLLHLFRAHHVRQVTLVPESGLGVIRLNVGAVRDFVQSFSKQFPCFRVHSVRLFRRHRKLFLEVQVDFRPSDQESLPERASAFQEALLTSMRTRFGVESISFVLFHVRNAGGMAGEGEQPRIPAE